MLGMVGEIRAFAISSEGTAFVPRGWRLCDGSLLDIRPNVVLYAILGATYGGDGIQTFALPDLRSRVPVGAGTAPGRPGYTLGQRTGTEQVPTQPVAVSTGGDPGTTVNSVAPAPGSNVQPVLGLTYCICTGGAFPLQQR